MGFFRRATEATTGVSAITRVVDRILTDVEEAQARGMHEITVSIGVNDIGMVNRLDRATPLIIREIQKSGHAVLDVDVTPSASHLRIRAATTSPDSVPAQDGSSDVVFAALEAAVPDDSRIDGRVTVEGRLALVAVMEANREWVGDLRMRLTDMQILVGEDAPAGVRVRSWERYDCVRYGYMQIPHEGHVVRCDFEDGSIVVFQFADANQAQALTAYCSSG